MAGDTTSDRVEIEMVVKDDTDAGMDAALKKNNAKAQHNPVNIPVTTKGPSAITNIAVPSGPRPLNFPAGPPKSLAEVRADLKRQAAETAASQVPAAKPLNIPSAPPKSLAEVREEMKQRTEQARKDTDSAKALKGLKDQAKGAEFGLKTFKQAASGIPGLGFLAAAGPAGAIIAGASAIAGAVSAAGTFFRENALSTAGVANPNLKATLEESKKRREIQVGLGNQEYTREESYRQQYNADLAKQRREGRLGILGYARAYRGEVGADLPPWLSAIGGATTGAGDSNSSYNLYKKKNPLLESFAGMPQTKSAGAEELHDLYRMQSDQGPLEQANLRDQLEAMAKLTQALYDTRSQQPHSW